MDLGTTYLGLRLRNPLVASAGPLSSTADGVRVLADAGVGAVVLPSLFEEQIRRESERDLRLASAGTESFAEALSYLPAAALDAWPYHHLRLLEKATSIVSIPVIASLNGVSAGGWTGYATALQDAGAAAIELNVYYMSDDTPPASPSPFVAARDAEQRCADLVAAVRSAVRIPVAVKIGPYFSSPGEMAVTLDRAGADGLVLFNRFMQAGIDPETFTVSVGFQLSSPGEAALPRTWISRLRGRVRCSLAASTGVETPADVAAYLLAGADVVMTTSALLRHGAGYAAELLDGLEAWLGRKGFMSVAEARGLLSAQAGLPLEGRAGYLSAIGQATRAFDRPTQSAKRA
ncbi:MAG TPA: dihydroorotate dehydrogenase-like protein [Trebonia sp.]|jgi:dihydroorotate dehydrogenase (fumarate)|nr:dihydroorotate dehydrogenase-like protein [Trebonia sp.]